MANQRPLTNEEGEVRELTESDFERFVPFSALPADLQQLLSSMPQLTDETEVAKVRCCEAELKAGQSMPWRTVKHELSH